MGPKFQIEPHQLDVYDNGMWVAEEKHDGHWAAAVTDESGKIVRIRGRSGKTFSNSNVDGLLGLNIGYVDCVLIAELEAGTEAATIRYDRIGFHRLHVFDAVKLLGKDTRVLPYEKRRQLLEIMFSSDETRGRVLLTKKVDKGFREFFESVSSQGGEGLVLKRKDRHYRPCGASGKTDYWVRCKQFHYVDYYVVEVGKSEGGSDNFQVGLVVDGKMQRVATIKNLPKYIKNPHEYVGKVIECKGLEVHRSGALRHGHFARIREDKVPEECTLEGALNS